MFGIKYGHVYFIFKNRLSFPCTHKGKQTFHKIVVARYLFTSTTLMTALC